MGDVYTISVITPCGVCVAYPPQDTWVGCVRGILEVGLSV